MKEFFYFYVFVKLTIDKYLRLGVNTQASAERKNYVPIKKSYSGQDKNSARIKKLGQLLQ